MSAHDWARDSVKDGAYCKCWLAPPRVAAAPAPARGRLRLKSARLAASALAIRGLLGDHAHLFAIEHLAGAHYLAFVAPTLPNGGQDNCRNSEAFASCWRQGMKFRMGPRRQHSHLPLRRPERFHRVPAASRWRWLSRARWHIETSLRQKIDDFMAAIGARSYSLIDILPTLTTRAPNTKLKSRI